MDRVRGGRPKNPRGAGVSETPAGGGLGNPRYPIPSDPIPSELKSTTTTSSNETNRSEVFDLGCSTTSAAPALNAHDGLRPYLQIGRGDDPAIGIVERRQVDELVKEYGYNTVQSAAERVAFKKNAKAFVRELRQGVGVP